MVLKYEVLHTYFMLLCLYSVWMLLYRVLRNLVTRWCVRHKHSALKSFIILFRSKCLKCLHIIQLFVEIHICGFFFFIKIIWTLIWTFTSIPMCFSRYAHAQKKCLGKQKPLNSKYVHLFRLISTSRQLR